MNISPNDVGSWLGVLFSTFIGASLAFLFGIRQRERQRINQEVTAGNLALSTLYEMWGPARKHRRFPRGHRAPPQPHAAAPHRGEVSGQLCELPHIGVPKNMGALFRQAQRGDAEEMQMRIGIGIAVVVAIGLIWSIAAMSELIPVASAG